MDAEWKPDGYREGSPLVGKVQQVPPPDGMSGDLLYAGLVGKYTLRTLNIFCQQNIAVSLDKKRGCYAEMPVKS